MKKYNENNERIKRKYLTFLKQAKGQNEASIDSVAKAIARFESYNQYKDFKSFHHQQAIQFKKHLANQKHSATGAPLSLATLHGTARYLKAFIQWLSQEAGYKSRVNYSDAEYFNLSEKEARTAKASKPKLKATIQQIEHTLAVMPATTAIEKRDRALIAFTLLSGARDRAIASLKMKHVDLAAETVYQDAREVETKFSKSFTTNFFPVGEEVLCIVADWIKYRTDECLAGNDDPLFPGTKMTHGDNNNFQASGLSNEHWKSAAPIRRIFSAAFKLAGLQDFKPHSFRNTLVTLGQKMCVSPEDFKAWSQNLGHESVLTTLYNYGYVEESRKSEIFKQLKHPRSSKEEQLEMITRAVAQKLISENR